MRSSVLSPQHLEGAQKWMWLPYLGWALSQCFTKEQLLEFGRTEELPFLVSVADRDLNLMILQIRASSPSLPK